MKYIAYLGSIFLPANYVAVSYLQEGEPPIASRLHLTVFPVQTMFAIAKVQIHDYIFGIYCAITVPLVGVIVFSLWFRTWLKARSKQNKDEKRKEFFGRNANAATATRDSEEGSVAHRKSSVSTDRRV